MKIYSKVELYNNIVDGFTATNMVISSNTRETDGSIKYDSSSHCLLYYSTEQIDGHDKGWSSVGSSGTTVYNNVNGILRIRKGSNNSVVNGSTIVSGSNFEATVATSSGSSTQLTFNLKTNGWKAGVLEISKDNSVSDIVSIDLLNGLYQQYLDEIMNRTIKYGTFEIDQTHTTLPITVRIEHDLGVRNLGLFLYKLETVGADQYCRCVTSHEYYVEYSPDYDVIITLDGGNIADIRGTYSFVLIGSIGSLAISSNDITITQGT